MNTALTTGLRPMDNARTPVHSAALLGGQLGAPWHGAMDRLLPYTEYQPQTDCPQPPRRRQRAGAEGPRPPYVVRAAGSEPTLLVRGNSRRIMSMRFCLAREYQSDHRRCCLWRRLGVCDQESTGFR